MRRPGDYFIAAAIQGSVLIWATVFVLPATCQRIRIRPYMPSIAELVSVFRNGWHLFLTNIAGFAYSSITVLILGLVAGKTQVGYYSAAEKLIRAASALLGPFTQALYPHLTALRAQSRESALRTDSQEFVVGDPDWLRSITRDSFPSSANRPVCIRGCFHSFDKCPAVFIAASLPLWAEQRFWKSNSNRLRDR